MIEEIFKDQKERQSKILSNNERIENLTKLYGWILVNRKKIKDALFADFNKSKEETDLSEIYPVIAEIRHAKANLKNWTKAKKVKKSLVYIAHSAKVKFEPKGVVLIISPWNYPFQLAIAPLVSALAAGNSVIIKPSEISENTSQLIEEMISEIFPSNMVYVVQGDKNIVTELLKFNFDHIFFTGSSQVGRIIAKAAAENLSSCTLELGGKSPVIVDQTANISEAAEKIVWGKFLNTGQTCVAPDFLLVNKNIKTELCEKIIEKINKYYGNEIEQNSDYTKIISDDHHDRLGNLLEDANSKSYEIIHGGRNNKSSRYFEPTIILASNKESEILQEEIFGPILPILEFDSLDEAITIIHENNPPLAIYIFSNNRCFINKICDSTKSGGIGINEVVSQFSHPNLPFGGVKESGIGRSHGFAGFKAFSNERSYLKSGRINLLKMIYPPFTNKKKKIIDLIVKYL